MHVRQNKAVAGATDTKILLSVDEAATMMSLGRTLVYALVRQGEIASIKLGKNRRIPFSALHDFVLRCLNNAEKGA